MLWNSYGHGREPTVFWGMKDARGRRLAWERDVEALILMGVWCGPTRPTPRVRKQGCVYGHTSGVEFARRHATEKSCQKLCKGGVLPLDRSLLMGVFLSVFRTSLDYLF